MGDLPDYSKKVIVVYEGTIISGEVQVDHRKIKGLTLKDPYVALCIPTSIENTALAYDSVNDRFKVVLEAITAGVIPVSLSTLLNPHPVSLSTLLNPHPVDITTDTLGGLKIVEKNATGVKVDLVTDTLAGLKVFEKNATGIKVDVVTDTLAGLKVTQATRTNLLAKPEREDLTSLGGVASPNNAGVQLVAPSGSLKVKVYDAGYEVLAAGLHYFYFGTTTAATTKRFVTRSTTGAILKSFVQPRVSAAGDGLYLFSAVSETNMPYDVGYVLE